MQSVDETASYLNSCRSVFWQKVFEAELAYILRHLKPGDEILSVGCGLAIIERSLAQQGFSVTGLDISQEALASMPNAIKAVVGSAEEMPFPDASFDLVLYIASLQFISDYRKALAQTARVLKPDGRMIAMLLNPASQFFKVRYSTENSYVSKLKHTDLEAIERSISVWLKTDSEYFLGIECDRLIERVDKTTTALYVLKGVKKQPNHD